MSDDPLLKALAKLAREERDAGEPAPLSSGANDRLLGIALGGAPRAKQKPRLLLVLGGATAALAAAAVAVLMLRSPGGAPLPAYDTTFEGGEQTTRGDVETKEVPRIPPGGRVALALRPSRPVEGPVVARAFAVRGGEARLLAVAPSVSSEGAARIAGTREEVLGDLPPGTWDLVLVVGRAGGMPDAGAIASPSYRPPDGVRIARKTILLP